MNDIAFRAIDEGSCRIAVCGGPGLWEVQPGMSGGEIIFVPDERPVGVNDFCVLQFGDRFEFYEVEWSHLGVPSIVERSGRGCWAFNPEDGSIVWKQADREKATVVRVSSPVAYEVCLWQPGIAPELAVAALVGELGMGPSQDVPTSIALRSLDQQIRERALHAEIKYLLREARKAVWKMTNGHSSIALSLHDELEKLTSQLH
ncbi:MAG: hypothetical protein BWY43_00098 [candidate division WS2 bacterium ADurb.Bin280]|uniref:Uncharacterized protein n=1 Tax=candidate division WS2 bacterium ADurb.Bin280 TaxID=1852829 RepID=A0A1V5SG57_9BACT|nr:MAG: hypothetical protein BWY43_00098 [candidate division WS2 bacterium ADurb.Bin280]